MDFGLFNIFRKQEINTRQIDELIGLCRGFCADGEISLAEAEYLQKWLISNKDVTDNPVIATLIDRVGEMLRDKHLDSEESKDLFDTLHKFVGGDFEFGEILKATTLPLDKPAPDVILKGSSFCLTGTFAHGSRSMCENHIAKNGGEIFQRITKKLDYLVIGAYATDSWIHSNYGRKIEKAVSYRSEGVPIAIISEEHWVKFV
jgi:NAD-dependent DNA ligase